MNLRWAGSEKFAVQNLTQIVTLLLVLKIVVSSYFTLEDLVSRQSKDSVLTVVSHIFRGCLRLIYTWSLCIPHNFIGHSYLWGPIFLRMVGESGSIFTFEIYNSNCHLDHGNVINSQSELLVSLCR